MANAELTDIERETFPALPQLYDLVKQSPTGYIKIARVEEALPGSIKVNGVLSGEETATLIEALSKCDDLFVTDNIHSAPDGIVVNIDNSFRKLPKDVDASFQSTLLDMDDFLENEKSREQLSLVIYFSKNCRVSLHVKNLKKENPNGRIFFRWFSDKKNKAYADLDLKEELKDLFVLAQKIVINKAMNGELEGIEFKHE